MTGQGVAKRPRALVTGASRGIGRACAVALAEAGCDVALVARTMEPGTGIADAGTVDGRTVAGVPGSLREVGTAVEAAGGDALLLAADLTVRGDVAQVAATVLDRWGGVDVLVHNGRHVGPGMFDPFLATPPEAYLLFLEAHCISPIVLTQALLPGMLDRGAGCIVTITSRSAWDPPPTGAAARSWGHAYAVGKAAGHQLVPSLWSQYGERGIRCFNVNPGYVVTERSRHLAHLDGRDAPVGGSPEAVGTVVAWLAGDIDETAALVGTAIDAQSLAPQLQHRP